ncbi:MAG: hypothetical protein HYX67_03585 [Candidatus Melainabacteria bacterium]|nr:hypothetical protein [Candidatus Melainabacteria bacterium]
MSAQIEQGSRNATSSLLKQLQSRGWLSVAFDSALLWVRIGFDKFADGMAFLMAGILTPKQARSLSIYATAFLIAVLMLVFCRELNLYCFRSVARNDSASAPKTNADHSMISKTDRNSTL